MKWREITEEQHAALWPLVRQEHPQSIAVLAFNDRFGKRPLLVQLPLFPELVRPACWMPQHNDRIR